MKKHLITICIGLVAIALSFLIGRATKQTRIIENITRDTLTIMKIDTLHEIIENPYKVYITDTIYIIQKERDTILSPLYYEHRYYRGRNYEAIVSGYEPKLSDITIFQSNRLQYITTTKKVEQREKKWIIGADMGIMYCTQFSPYILGEVEYLFSERVKGYVGIGVGFMDEKRFYSNIGLRVNILKF